MPFPDCFTSSVYNEALGSWSDPCDPPPARPLTSDEQSDLRVYTVIAARLRALRDDFRGMQLQGPVKDLEDWLPVDFAADIEGLLMPAQEAIATIQGRPDLERDQEQLEEWDDVS